MSENEGDTQIPFIDDVEEQTVAGELAQREYNLTITRNYQNKTRRVEISKILHDVEPMTHRSLSPIAPLANDTERLTDEEEGEALTGAEFELTIKSNNSVIRIQGYDNKSTISFDSRKGGNVYDLISKEVDKIFRKPDREEIEKAMKSIKSGDKRMKQKNWKALTKSLIRGGKLAAEQRRGSVERYPKMVLLQDEKSQSEEDNYPKMVMIDDRVGGSAEIKKKKFQNHETKEKKESVKGKEKKPMKNPENNARDVTKEKENQHTNAADEERKRQCICEDCTKFAKFPAKNQLNVENEDSHYSSIPPFCQYPSLYVPVYNRHLPYFHCNSGDFCGGGRILKDTTTQTNPSDVQPDVAEEPKDMNDLPFEFLSSFFPRIVVMKSFHEEVPDEDTKVFELPKNEVEKEDEKCCEELDEKREEQEPPPFEDGLNGEEMENGFSEESGKEENVTSDELPLTKIGYSIYDKLNELAIERKKGEEKADEAETKKSPRNITFEFRNKLMRFTLSEDKVNLEVQEDEEGEDKERKPVTGDKMVVTKNGLWYPTIGERARKDLTPGKDHDKLSFSISERENLVFTFEMGKDSPRKTTSEAKVGTDGLDVAGGDFIADEGIDKKNLSPRKYEILKNLRDKLEETEGVKKLRSRNGDFKFPGLFLIRPIDWNRGFPRDEYYMSKEREARKRKEIPGQLREYYCEDCLATMRLFEDEKVSVKNMVDKFETIIHLGSY